MTTERDIVDSLEEMKSGVFSVEVLDDGIAEITSLRTELTHRDRSLAELRADWEELRTELEASRVDCVRAAKELVAEMDAGRLMASEVAEWREADMYGDMLGTVAGDYDKQGDEFDATGYAHRESVRAAKAACDNNGIAAAHIASAKKGDER